MRKDGRTGPVRIPPAILLILLLAGCTDPATDGPTPTSEPPVVTAPSKALPSSQPSASPAPPSRATPPPGAYAIPSGILYRDPATSRLRASDGIAPRIDLMPSGFDVRAGIVAQGDNRNAIRVWDVLGTMSTLRVELNHIGRLSLSPDGSRAVVQATTAPLGQPPTGSSFDVYVIDLADGAVRRLSETPYNAESPEWSPTGDLIAWSSFSPEEGIDLHLARPDGSDHRVLDDAGGIHSAFSPDGMRILDPGRMRILDVASGEVTADLRDEAIAAVRAEGYDLDTRFPGQAGRGTFPLDGAFSPDGTSLVFDGAVVKDGEYGILIMTMRLDGTAFRVVAGPLEVDPARTNGHNYSETNPLWR